MVIATPELVTDHASQPTPKLLGTFPDADQLRIVAGIDRLVQVLHGTVEEDPYLDAQRQAALQELQQQDSWLRLVVANTIHYRPLMGPSHLNRHIYRATAYALNNAPSPTGARHDLFHPRGEINQYPRDYNKPIAWQSGWAYIRDTPTCTQRFLEGMLALDLQSNVMDRYKGLKAFAVIAKGVGRIATRGRRSHPDHVRILDVGGSLGLGMDALAYGIPFNPPNIYEPHDDTEYILDADASAAYQQLTAARLLMEQCAIVDIANPAATKDWAVACSMNPNEQLDPLYTERFKATLAKRRLPDNPTRFVRGDFTTMDPARFGHKFDIVHLATVLYMLSPDKREQMIANAVACANEFVVVQDFLSISDDTYHLDFRGNWADVAYPYQAVVMDVRDKFRPVNHQRLRWQQFMAWQNGRVMRGVIGNGSIAPRHGQPIPFRQAMHMAAAA